MASVGINPSFLREIPDFIVDSIVHCDGLLFKKNEKSIFLLAKNLKFYEFRKKQLQNSLDLSETCLSTIQQQINAYHEETFLKKCKLNDDSSKASCSQIQPPNGQESTFIQIGKYIYRNFEISKLYMILQCWDKLIIMEHNGANGIKLTAEYEKVTCFKIVPNKLIKYQAQLQIQFDDGVICTDFQENCFDAAVEFDAESNGGEKLAQKKEFKHLLDRVRSTKAELQMHKEITQKQFQNLCNEQNFGNNFLRSIKLEEKYMLSKCGDLWLRVTATDELVIGLPLVNNCAPPNLTILKNLQPIININEDSLNVTKETNNNNLQYEHRLYQLRQQFENLETLETFFQTQDENFKGESTWQRTAINQLPPNAFVVMLLKLKLSQLILTTSPSQLFVRFEVEKDLETFEPKTEIFEQHLFIKTLDFQQVLQQRSIYEVSFQEQTLHQDLLAMAMTSHDKKLKIEFTAQSDFDKFENLLTNKYDFEIIRRKLKIQISCDATTMDIDEPCEDFDYAAHTAAVLFYNRKPNSLWFGSLLMRRGGVPESNIGHEIDEPIATNWIFYNKNEEKSYLMLKLLFDELISIKCNIKSIKYAEHQHDCRSKIISFENAIREELIAFSDLYKIGKDSQFQEKYQKLAEQQFHTDLIANNI